MRTHIGYNGLSLGIMAFAVLLVLLVPRQAVAVDFGQDVTVTSDSHRQEYPSAVVSPNGDIFVMWQDDKDNPGITSDIYCARSTDNGSTFSAAVKVDDSSGNSDHIYPQITVDSYGKLHAVWADYRGGSYYQIYYANSTDNGSTWSANVQVNYTVTGTQTQPSIAMDSVNNIYVAWDDGRSGSHVYMAKSTDGGTSFGAAKKVDSSTGTARHSWICVAPNDNVSVAWEDSRNSNWDIFLVTSTDGGTSFGSEVNVTTNTSGSSQTYPRVAADPNSNLDVVWSDNRDGDYGVYCGASSDGSTFSAVAVNDTDTGISASQPASLAVDSAGVVHVAWQDKRSGSGHFRIYYSESDGSGGFISSVRVDNTTTADCYHPFVTVDPNDVPSVVWDDNRNGNEDIFYDTPQNVPPLAPDLGSPAADTWVNTGTPAFNWTFRDVNSSDTQSAFQLQVAAASDFGQTTYDSGVVLSTTSAHTPASSIADGVYYWRVRTRDNGGAWGPYSSGRVIKIDTIAPTSLAPLDIGNWSTSTTINFTWTPSTDNGSGVAGYFFCLGTTAGGTDIVSDAWTATPNYSYAGGINGTTYYAKVKAEDNATNLGAYGGSSDGITVDVTVPTAAAPSVSGQYTNSSLVKFSWVASDDFPSGIAGYYISVGSGAGLNDLLKDFWTASNSYTYAGGLNGVTYYAMVKAEDNAGNIGAYGPSSGGITVDTSIPTSYTPQDNGTYSNQSTLYWYWPPSYDTPSGIAGYYVSIGTSYGANDTLADNFTTSTSITLAGAVDGKTYYCRLFAVDNAGNIGPFSSSSDGITVDTTPPTDFTVVDDGDYTPSNTTFHAVWTSATDDVSLIAEYQYEIGTASAPGSVVGWTTAGTANSVTRKGLDLQNGIMYFITVRARNGANLLSNLSVSDGIVVDTTVPLAGTPAAPAGYATSTSVTWNWTASADAFSGIKGYYISIGSSPGGSDVVHDAFTPDVSYTYPSALNGRTYYAKIKAATNAGNVGAYGGNSNGVLVDISIPVAATPTDTGRYSTTTTLVFNWSASEDAPSGIAGYFLSIGTTPGGSDVLRELFTTNLTYTLAGAAEGTTFYAEIRAVDNAGNEGPWSAPSDGIMVDTTPPSPPVVYGGGYLINATQLELSWGPSIDLETPVNEYLYAVGTTRGGTDIVPWTSAGVRLSLTVTGLGLVNGKSYYVSARSRNAAGLLSDIATGGSVMVDNIAPLASAPVPTGAFTNSSVVTFAWNESTDAESGIAGYYVYIGTTPGGNDILDGVWTPRAAYAFIGGLNGVTYYASVQAVDRAGNIGPLSPPGAGVTVDTSMPSAYPPVAPSAYSMYPNITWTWTPSTGSPSGVAGYYVSVGTLLGGEDAVKDHFTATTSYTFAGGVDGKTYYVKLRAQDNAGNLGGWVTGAGGVTVDLTTPTGNVTIEGGAATTARTGVMLTLDSPDPFVSEMMLSQYPNMAGAAWEPFARSRSWQLSMGDGNKTVYVKFRSLAGQESELYSASITLDTIVTPFKLASSAGTETRDSETTISGNVEPGSRVFINGELLYYTGDGTFHKSVQLQEGSNVITVTVVDSAGNSATQTLSVWRTPATAILSSGGDTTLIMVLALIAIILVLVVLVVGIRTQRMLSAHLKEHRAPEGHPVVRKRVRPPEQPVPKEERPEEKVRPVKEPWPTEPSPPEEVQAGAHPEAGREEPPMPAYLPEQAPSQEQTTYQEYQEPAQYQQPAYEVQPEPQQQWTEAPRPAYAAESQPGEAAYPPATPQRPPQVQPREGDMVIRADGTEAPAEPRLISEWSPDTGRWQPVSEEPSREEAAPPATQAPSEEASGQMAIEPSRALEEFARSAAPREAPTTKAEAQAEPPVPSAPAQRLSAKQIYAALYGKRGAPAAGAAVQAPTAVAAAPAAQAPPAPAPAQAAPVATAAQEQKVIGRARCANCRGIIPIYSTERPLRIKCPTCGLEGMIK